MIYKCTLCSQGNGLPFVSSCSLFHSRVHAPQLMKFLDAYNNLTQLLAEIAYFSRHFIILIIPPISKELPLTRHTT